ncbi:MAG: hypothetical protein JNJ42_12575 [Burkholderiaceae bacterium]|nr:hypothetical protein [Burkholderiaceae bacterium]
MNVLPIRREAATPPFAAEPEPPTREDVVRQTANLARALADVLMSNVQNTTSLNLAAARALLAHARIPVRAGAEQQQESWRTTWRSFEVCATSAEQMLGLTRGHVERTTAALWRGAERMLEELAQAQAQRVNELLACFDALRAAQDTYWQAAQRAHQELVALAQSPYSPTRPEPPHDAH